jgi:hypothetical protein
MEESKPNRWLGVTSGLALMALVIALDVVIIRTIRQAEISIVTFFLSLLLIASLVLLGLVAYWLYGLVQSGFFVDRNALVIRWGATTQVIPMGSIEAVLPGDQVKGIERFRGPMWPGMRVGYGQLEEIGPTLFFATGPLRKQVILTTPALAYALSPSNSEVFLEAVRRRLSMGPTQSVEQASRQPTLLTWSFWSDSLALALLVSGLILLVALFGYITWRYPSLTEPQPLHFDAAGQPDRWGTPAQVFTLPFIGLLAMIANGGLGFLLYERERPASYLLWSGALVVQLLVWGATVGILR